MPWFKVQVKSVYVTLQNSLVLKKNQPKNPKTCDQNQLLLVSVHILVCLDIQTLCAVLKDWSWRDLLRKVKNKQQIRNCSVWGLGFFFPLKSFNDAE